MIWKFHWMSHYFQKLKSWSAITQHYDAASNPCPYLPPSTQHPPMSIQHLQLKAQAISYSRRRFKSRCCRRLCPFFRGKALNHPTSLITFHQHLIIQQHQSSYSRQLNALRHGWRLCSKFCGRTLVRWVVVWCFLWFLVWTNTAEALQKFL